MKQKKDIKKVVLAYSGGLDTSIIIPWLKENYNNCEVIAVSGDVGQGTELDGLEEKAKKTGASKLYILDLKKDYVENYIWPCLKADAKYEDYLLGTSHARPCIAKALAEIAHKEGADAICHGCTGKGNDQVRFELTLKAFAPDMAIIAPWREWNIESRDEEIDYAEAHNIPLRISRETNYSKDKNLWHLSHEGLDLESPANEPQYNKEGFLELGVSPEQAPDVPTYVTIHFEKGVPTQLDGKELDGVAMVEALNKVGGANGIGLLDIVENRLVGMKSRGVYETPGGAILYQAHKVLETITLDKETSHFKAIVGQKYADLVYNGQWFTPLREAMDAFVDSTQKTVTGDVKLKLYKGNIITASVTSPYTLYDEQTASFGVDEDYNQADAAGFINLFGLSIKERAKLSAKWPEIK
ncbi:MAG: argininosuccinate synthase [Oscillospiraceae bacterium]|nr:argininosuccinate synthase [Bacteroidales bacterium]MDD6997964.1 argininosuccinate synthase [Oscillospiraceae bacterium]MDY5096387.1 argininosuccinate synthase [Oscillospiraceae bacterium]